MKERVAILGASNRPDRFAYKAFKLLQEYGHTPLLVNPVLATKMDNVEGFPLRASLMDWKDIDTVTMYVGPAISSTLVDDILAVFPKRVIFNPGSENPKIESSLKAAGIEIVEDCTLVMLRANAF